MKEDLTDEIREISKTLQTNMASLMALEEEVRAQALAGQITGEKAEYWIEQIHDQIGEWFKMRRAEE